MKNIDTSVCVIKHDRYNKLLVDKCHELGCESWGNGAWFFSRLVTKEVRELDILFNSKSVAVEITALCDLYENQESVFFCGYPLATAAARDSGANLGKGICLISGKIDSGGSVKHWSSLVKKGTVLRLFVSEILLDQNREQEKMRWDIKLIDLE